MGKRKKVGEISVAAWSWTFKDLKHKRTRAAPFESTKGIVPTYEHKIRKEGAKSGGTSKRRTEIDW